MSMMHVVCTYMIPSGIYLAYVLTTRHHRSTSILAYQHSTGHRQTTTLVLIYNVYIIAWYISALF